MRARSTSSFARPCRSAVHPSSVWPSDVPGFRVAWSVVGERVHSRKTPFLRALDLNRYDPGYPYYGGWYFYGSFYGYPGYYGGWPYRYYYGWPAPWRGPRVIRGPRIYQPR